MPLRNLMSLSKSHPSKSPSTCVIAIIVHPSMLRNLSVMSDITVAGHDSIEAREMALIDLLNIRIAEFTHVTVGGIERGYLF